MNKLLKGLKEKENLTYTLNGALTHKSTNNKCLDLFALGGAYRGRPDEDCIKLFQEAFEEDSVIALKLLFYIRDVRDGLGERRFFRVCYRWLALDHPDIAKKYIQYIPKFGRWDDLYSLFDTPLEKKVLDYLTMQFIIDQIMTEPSLLFKWLPSENTSSKATRKLATKIRTHFDLSPREYRKALSAGRKKLKLVETAMSQNQWNSIEYDKLPSIAGFKYKNAFLTKDKKRYLEFINSNKTKVNAATLYPYQVVSKVINSYDNEEREILNKYWDNLKDYFNGKEFNGIAVVDTSGSMYGTPINVAISLGLYLAEKAKGPFANHYISFSSKPQLIETRGKDFFDKVVNIYKTNLIENTNIEAVFDLILDTAIAAGASQEDLPENIIIISDMEFDLAVYSNQKINTNTLLENMYIKFKDYNYTMPKLIFWNVNSYQNNIPVINPNEKISYVSGFTPAIFETLLSGKTGIELMLETISKYDFISSF